jgi:mannose/fructose/N-acetylgalactosamine-specific phosphotransferase system component IIB
MDHCLLRLRECETNIEELKHLNVDDDRKYERIIKKNLLMGLTGKVRILVKGLNDIKNINTGGPRHTKNASGGGMFNAYDEEDQSEFNFLSQHNPNSDQMSIF